MSDIILKATLSLMFWADESEYTIEIKGDDLEQFQERIESELKLFKEKTKVYTIVDDKGLHEVYPHEARQVLRYEGVRLATKAEIATQSVS